MRSYTAVVEKCPDTGLYVGYIPGWSGAHSQGESLEALEQNLQEAVQNISPILLRKIAKDRAVRAEEFLRS